VNIAGILEQHASAFPDRVAIVEAKRRITFAELDRAAARAARDLSNLGLSHGMRALVFCPMSIDLYTCVIGMFRLGVTAVFVDPSVGASTLAACVARVRPDAFVAVPRAHLLRLLSPALRRIRIRAAIGGGIPGIPGIGRRTSGATRDVESCDETTAAIITFTSGTTGPPKAAVRTHGFLRAQHRALAANLKIQAGEVDLTTLPIFLLANLASGVTSVIPDANLRTPGSIDAPGLMRQIRRERPVTTVASPVLLERLAAQPAGGEPLPFRKVFTGGAPVFPRTLDALARSALAASVTALYGSTEAEPIASIDRRDITAADRGAMRQGAGVLTGRPAASIDVRILPDRWGQTLASVAPDDFARSCLPVGCVGEIVVTGEHVLSGYLDAVGDDESKIAVGDRVWHRTGDAGYFDAQGRLWLLGRCSARVADADGVLYPLSVECAVNDVPGVRRSAFVSHEGRRVLVIEPDGAPPPPRELLRRLDWAGIDSVMPLKHIPVDRRHNAKIDLASLQRMLQAI
jgi:acyl-CoA synthetase (AMP-forming)/AMP-acid ligase II